MPVYLNKQQKDYLKLKLKNILETDFIGKNIIKEIEIDDTRLSDIEACKHEDAEYTGDKKCCIYCGTFQKGGFESWELKIKK